MSRRILLILAVAWLIGAALSLESTFADTPFSLIDHIEGQLTAFGLESPKERLITLAFVLACVGAALLAYDFLPANSQARTLFRKIIFGATLMFLTLGATALHLRDHRPSTWGFRRQPDNRAANLRRSRFADEKYGQFLWARQALAGKDVMFGKPDALDGRFVLISRMNEIDAGKSLAFSEDCSRFLISNFNFIEFPPGERFGTDGMKTMLVLTDDMDGIDIYVLVSDENRYYMMPRKLYAEICR